jgi:thiol-disulfide isomerase/thioredoxin
MAPQAKDSPSNDWRETLFGSFIQKNQTPTDTVADEESPLDLVPTTTAFDTNQYEYIAIFIGANYCPHCKEFAPTVVAGATALENNKCKVIFVSNDRDQENFQASCHKNAGIDVMPYDLDKTKAMRDLFDLKTIPALMILRNGNFDADTPTIVTNGRHALVADPQAKSFPWTDATKPTSTNDENKHVSTVDRLVIRGKYGTWWQLGHFANPAKPDEMYMDEHAVRARAGILNVITWIAIMNVFFWKEKIYVAVLFPIVSWEFLMSMIFGLTPFAPIGVLGSLLAIWLHPEPMWKPAKPKRFAWLIGLILASLCLTWFMNRQDLGGAYRPLIGATVLTCNLATWLESSCGFCLGCFIYNTYLVKWFKLEECQECKI